MRRISVCAVLFLSSALGFGRQQPPYPGQAPFFATPPAIPGDALQQQEQSQNQGELREALRACAQLLVAATSVSCPGDAAQQKAQPQQQPPQPPANLQEKSGGNSQIQSDLRGSIRACAALLLVATSVPCPGEAAQEKAQPQRQPPQPAANPQEKSGANSQFLSNLQSDLKGDPGLSGTDVEATVDDVKITLTGTVHSQAQLDRVMALTSPYAYYRKVVNNVTVK
jgi:BON domain